MDALKIICRGAKSGQLSLFKINILFILCRLMGCFGATVRDLWISVLLKDALVCPISCALFVKLNSADFARI